MAVRYHRARLLIAATLAAGVVTGTAYFAASTPSGASPDTGDGSTPTSIQPQKVRQPSKTARRSRGS